MAVLTVQQKLDAAQAAYESLISGGSARVFVDQNGERIEYNPGSAPRLYSYILTLQSMLTSGATVFPGAIQRPMRPFF